MRGKLSILAVFPAALLLPACGASSATTTTSAAATTTVAPLETPASTVVTSPTATVGPAPTAPQRTVVASGTGTVSAPPDQVVVHLGVEAQGPTVSDALNKANSDMTNVLAALKNQGVQAADITTTQLSVGRSYPGPAPYQVDEGVDVTIHHISNAGGVIVAAAKAAANDATAWGLTYSIHDPSALIVQAREKAMDAARAAATQWAQLAGYSLSSIVSVSDVLVSSPPQASGSQGYGGGGVPISPGTNQVTVTVYVTYAMS